MAKTPRDRYLLRTYGITQEIYDEILRLQGGGCAICGKTPEQEKRNLAVEHDHKTKEIFGLCCSFCNLRLLGRIRDPKLFLAASKYLERGLNLFVPIKKKKKRKRHGKSRCIRSSRS